MRIIAKKYKCFSLVELMVVISIIGIMSVVAYASLNAPKRITNVNIAQREVTAAIKLAQSYALQGKMEKTGTGGRLVAPCGYGFRFTSSTDYEIFYNPGPDNFGSLECENKNNLKGAYVADPSYRHWKGPITTPANSKTAVTGSLKNGVTLSTPAFGTNPTATEIYFANPAGEMFNNVGSAYTVTSFFFANPASPSINKEIVINPKGGVTEK